MKKITLGFVASFLFISLAGITPARSDAMTTPAAWKNHSILQLNGLDKRIELPAMSWVVSEKWNERAQLPYMAYMPEKNRLLLQLDRQMNEHPGCMMMYSDDGGASWCNPYFMHTDAKGKPDAEAAYGLTYLGNGKLIAAGSRYWFSSDHGVTWGGAIPVPNSSDGKPLYEWGPLLVDTDPHTGKVVRLMETRYKECGVYGNDDYTSQGCVRFSTDEGQTWGKEIEVPEWRGVNEVEQIRANNGDIVALCRIDLPKRFRKTWNDNYCGLGVSISKDNGYTWTKINTLFDWGRHHQSPVLMPNGDIVVSYLVRRGYPNTADGAHGQFGVEAVVSHDNGQSWDLDHRYILMVWESPISSRDTYTCMAAGCVTSSVALPDGSIITAVGDGHRLDPTRRDTFPRDVTLIKWRLNPKPTNTDKRISNARYDSDIRNKLNPYLRDKAFQTIAEKNIATVSEGAKVTSSPCSLDPTFILYDPYLYPECAVFATMPAWIQITWPKPHTIDEVNIWPADPGGVSMPSTECVPLDYQLQYLKNGEWVDATPPVTNAQRYTEWHRAGQRADEFLYTGIRSIPFIRLLFAYM